MSDELEIIKKLITPMEEIINATPGERFSIKESDTLIIVERRMEDSDLRRELHAYNEIFALDAGADIKDITKSMVAFIKIKALVNAGQTDFDPRLLRALIKEYKAQLSKVINIIKLSRINAMSAAPFEKEKIELTASKNEAFLEGFEAEIIALEKKIERLPKVPEESEALPKNKSKPVKEMPIPEEKKTSFVSKFKGMIEEKHHKKDVGERLRVEESKQSKTRCVELPFYDSVLNYTESFVCKDIPEYSILKRKNDVYFGLTKNVKPRTYDNADGSLYELTEATEDFIQYMTVDLLNGDYELDAYQNIDKESLRMYFDFVCVCFAMYIGKTLSILEYLKFKRYYNELVTKFLKLEEELKDRYYEALVLAEKYIDYMDIYDMAHNEDVEEIIADILADKVEYLTGDLKLIHDNHVVSDESKEMILALIESIKDFNKKEEPVEEEEEIPLPAGFKIALSDSRNRVVVKFMNEEGVLLDEGLYATNNLEKALEDFKNRCAPVKRIGIRTEAGDLFFEEDI